VPGEYDYVIAGGISAGCTLAARLAEVPSFKVCLVEAGDW
jgi:choline dehydrogenase-like flavoprotein